jgi:hypothetical protein
MYNKYNTLIYADAKKQHLSIKKSQNWGETTDLPRFLWFISLFEYGAKDKALEIAKSM